MKKNKILKIFLVLLCISPMNTQAQQQELRPQEVINMPLRNGVSFPVYFRQGLPLDAQRSRYQGFKQETQILKKGSIRMDGAKPLECDIVFERDVAIQLRDGTTINADVFRPVEDGNYPSILAWSPYGKQIGGQWLDDLPGRAGVPFSATSQIEKFEGPDPVYWVNKGYVIVNPDTRGSYSSEGNLTYWGYQNSLDGYDVIEWMAKQPWSNGKVGMSGNSWLAVSQWFIASQKPPHLCAIAPWEGFSDHFRESSHRGGIPDPTFAEIILETFSTKNRIENQPRMIVEYPLMNDYWEDKAPILENIEIPAYIVASYDNPVHSRGTFEGWNRISSTDKWLRIHNTHEWMDYYDPDNVSDLTLFFDHYLKGEDNGWECTLRVRMSVLNPGGEDIVNRPEKEFPLERTQYERLYLNAASNNLISSLPLSTQMAEYNCSSSENSITYTYTLTEDKEISGYMKLRLWVEAIGSDDMDLSVTIGKLSPEGNPYQDDVKATGMVRVSMRETDPIRSTEEKPYYYFRQELPLKEGEIVPVDIEIWPIAMKFTKGEQLELTIKAFEYLRPDLGFGSAIVELPVEKYTYMPGENIMKIKMGGNQNQVANPNDVIELLKSQNKGIHRFYMGGIYDSYLYIPVIPDCGK